MTKGYSSLLQVREFFPVSSAQKKLTLTLEHKNKRLNTAIQMAAEAE